MAAGCLPITARTVFYTVASARHWLWEMEATSPMTDVNDPARGELSCNSQLTNLTCCKHKPTNNMITVNWLQ
jgi:hypothetical protein